MSFKERIRFLRNEKELTQKELGSRVSLAESTISLYETGDREPDFDTLTKIANFFNVSIDYLLGRTDEKVPSDMTIFDPGTKKKIDLTALPEDKQKTVIEFYNFVLANEENERKMKKEKKDKK